MQRNKLEGPTTFAPSNTFRSKGGSETMCQFQFDFPTLCRIFGFNLLSFSGIEIRSQRIQPLLQLGYPCADSI
jgi:hypothetical protein